MEKAPFAFARRILYGIDEFCEVRTWMTIFGPVRDVVKNPLHPYAKGLMGAIPTLAGEDKRLVQIPGSMPRLAAIPKGCPFNPRCNCVFDRCRVERPEPLLHGMQAVACHLYDISLRDGAA